jgi:hypothetical protein
MIHQRIPLCIRIPSKYLGDFDSRDKGFLLHIVKRGKFDGSSSRELNFYYFNKKVKISLPPLICLQLFQVLFEGSVLIYESHIFLVYVLQLFMQRHISFHHEYGIVYCRLTVIKEFFTCHLCCSILLPLLYCHIFYFSQLFP